MRAMLQVRKAVSHTGLMHSMVTKQLTSNYPMSRVVIPWGHICAYTVRQPFLLLSDKAAVKDDLKLLSLPLLLLVLLLLLLLMCRVCWT